MSRRAGLPVLVAALLLPFSLVSAPGEAAGAGPRVQAPELQSAPLLRPSTATPGQHVKVEGRLGTKVERRVLLERKVGSVWERVGAVESDSTGRYRFTYPAPGTSTRLRVKAPAFDTRGRHFGRLVSAPTRLVVRQVVLRLPAKAQAAGSRTHAVVRTTRAHAGKTVSLQRRTGSTWHLVAARMVKADGVARIPLPTSDLGTGAARLRVFVPGLGATPGQTVEVLPPARILTPRDDEAVGDAIDVVVKVDGDLTATRVQVYLDGFVMPDAQPVSNRPGRWSATIRPASVGLNRRHVDVVARVTTAAGSALTEPVRVDLAGASGGVPVGFRIDTVVAGLTQPTSFAPVDERRTLVALKSGVVRLVTDGVVATTPVLDIRPLVEDAVDSGILDVALDPGFAQNGWFYLTYVAEDGGGTLFRSQRVVRYTFDGVTADPDSAHVLVGDVPRATCQADPTTPGCLLGWNLTHTIDDLLFLPDGSLLVSVGDGSNGDPSRALLVQDLDVLAGKILRIDPETGLGLPDNPYYDATEPAANRNRVWAYGFRNPFRMTLSPEGALYAGDVGEFTWEEVDRVVEGGNYGWPCFEGNAAGTAPAGAAACDDVRTGTVAHRTPLVAYPHVDVAGSVTLGVFAGPAYPEEYQGQLFLNDFTQARIWTLDVDEPVLRVFGTGSGLGVGVAYGTGPDGTIWYADIAAGSIRSIVYDPAADACASGEFLEETFRNRDFIPEPDGDAWVSNCVGTPPRGGPDEHGEYQGLLAPGQPNQGEGWSMRWSGTPQLAPGTYRLTADASGTIMVRVDGKLVPDGGTFTVTGDDVNEATANVVVELTNYPPYDDVPVFVDFDWFYELSWERVGTAPEVTLHDLGQGGRVAPGSTVGWRVSAVDADDGVLGADRVRVDVTLLHYGTGSPHRHPGASIAGFRRASVVDDDHANGKIAYRLVGVAVDSTGWVAESDPVYVCLVDNRVGPCG